jgi:hypothetical protein
MPQSHDKFDQFKPSESDDLGIPEGVMETMSEGAKMIGQGAKAGFQSASPSTKMATVATGVAGVVGSATGQLPPDVGLVIASSAPALPFLRQGAEMLGKSSGSRNSTRERKPIKEALNPVKVIKGLMEPPNNP